MMDEKAVELILKTNALLVRGETCEKCDNEKERGSFEIEIKDKDGLGYYTYDLKIMNSDGSPRISFLHDVPIDMDGVLGFVNNGLRHNLQYKVELLIINY